MILSPSATVRLPPALVICPKLSDPANLGAMARIGDVFGIDAMPNLKALADEVFSCSIGGRLVFDSYAAYLLLASAVLEAMSDAAPAQAQGHLEEYERMVQDQSIFLAD